MQEVIFALWIAVLIQNTINGQNQACIGENICIYTFQQSMLIHLFNLFIKKNVSV